eukprot:gb/GFBE01054635.1/.p1 GENE.gb/GFBE01054635.1/~~gb/GFBE01054635.1/.p1  ORF type:complete len:676 (+),score=110.54 gb/GFBE01054635.1/:1-2028(+)
MTMPAASGLRSFVVLCFLAGRTSGTYDPERKIEHARLYGNVDQYAYYFVDLVVGTPPQRVSVILDTGSGVCAYPCASCSHCGKHIDPAFDFGKSTSAKWLQCSNGRCPSGRCSSGKCSYYQGYTEGSSISGFWFEDMVGVGDMIQQNPQVIARMGCHSNENNLFYTQKANGIMGVGPGGLANSAILDKIFKDHEHVTHKVFSICLAEWGGRLNVGGYDDSYHIGPMQKITLRPGGFYSVSLTGMKVNGKTIATSWGSTMIDSGTTYTYMKSSNYRALKSSIESYCSSHSQCGGTKHGDCWTLPSGPTQFPNIVVVFGNVETQWVPRAYLYRKGSGSSYCYGFQDDGPSAGTVLGSVWMIHQEIVFDMENSQVGIAQANCPEHKDRPSHVVQVTTTREPEATTLAETTLQPSTTSPPPPTLPPTLPPTIPATPATAAPQPPTVAPTQAPPAAVPSTTQHASAAVAEVPAKTNLRPTSAPAESPAPAAPGAPAASSQVSAGQSSAGSMAGPSRVSSTASPSTEVFQPLSALGQDPLRFVGAVAVGVVSACLCLLLIRQCCRCCCRDKHRHVQLKDAEESGMPPQIVGGVGDEGGFDAFVIGEEHDDEHDHLSENGFEYVDGAGAHVSGAGFNFGNGAKQASDQQATTSDLLDMAFSENGDRRRGANGAAGSLDGPLD